MIQVTVNNQPVNLTDRDVIGTGGEANVFAWQGQALKLYHQPDKLRDKKLRAMLPLAAKLPAEVIAPQELVYNAAGRKVLGFTMRLLPPDFTEVRQLSTKKFRAMQGISAKDVARLFYHAGQTLRAIHQAGMVVGDLNDLNLMFRAADMLFIDTDSFQFDNYPCMVGTEAFIDPALYNCDLAAQPLFSPVNDWYSFAVLLFKSLLLVHPYGGVHKTVNLLTQRAAKRLSIFAPDVTYPCIAYPLELVDDTLLHTFAAWFTHGQRGDFPLEQIRAYADGLRACASCGELYPAQRSRCPHCSSVVPAAAVVSSQARTLLRLQGQIVAWHVAGVAARFVAHEAGKAVYYALQGQTQTKRLELFDALPTAAYAFMDDMLVIAPAPESSDLYVLDVSGAQPAPMLPTTTGQYGQGERVFAAGGGTLYRLANGYLMRGEFRLGQYTEQAVMAIAEGQTQIFAAPDGGQVFGMFRVFNQYAHWLLIGKQRVDLNLPALDAGEFLIDMSVKFGAQSLLILRLTQLNGVEQIRLDEVATDGRVLRSMTLPSDKFTSLDAPAYARGMLLYTTDNGIVREQFDTGATTTFTQTESIVKTGQRLFAYENGLLVVGDDKVMMAMG